MSRRQARAARTRAKLVAAARRMLMTREGLARFSMEAVATRAGVTRLTIYHQFGSKRGLLEAVYDDLARRGRIAENLAAAFQNPDPVACLEAAMGAFVHFWHAERQVVGRLRSMAALDPAFRGATRRDERRLAAMRAALCRLAEARGRSTDDLDETAAVLSMLTSFETFEALADSKKDVKQVLEVIARLARAATEQPEH